MTGRRQVPGGRSWATLVIGDWADQANCAGCDADVFYPPEVRGRRTRSVLAGDCALAKQICRECVVVEDCLRYALEHQEPWGIWGGTTPTERNQLEKAATVNGLKPMTEMDHGDEAGAKAHQRRGEKPCVRCQEGAAVAARERRHKLARGRRG